MKKHGFIAGWLALLALAVIHLQPLPAFGQGTAFTYQGCLNAGGSPANGSYDLEFTICDAAAGGNHIAGPLTNAATGVTNGLFTVTLDFGQVFNGSNYWLEIAARAGGDDGFTTLSPRQALTPAPYSIFAAKAGSAAALNGALPGGSLSGTYSNAVALTNAANQFSGSFAGNGSGLSNIQAASLTGTVPSASLDLDANDLTTNASGQVILTNVDMSVNLGNLPNLTRALASNVPPRFLWFGDSTGNYVLPSFQTWLQNYSSNHAIQFGGPYWGGPYWGPMGNESFESQLNYFWTQNGSRAISAGTNIICGGPAFYYCPYALGNEVQVWMEASASNGIINLSYGPDLVHWTNLGTLNEAALGAEGLFVVTNFSVPLGKYALNMTCTSGTFRWVGIGVIQTNSTVPIFYDMHAPGVALPGWTNMGTNIGIILSNVNPCVTFYEQTKALNTYNNYTNFAWWMSNFAPNSDVVLISSYEDSSDPPNGPVAGDNYQRNVFAQAVAISNHWPFVDVMTPLGPWSNIVAEGLNLDSIVHLNTQGQNVLSQIVMQKLNFAGIWQEAGQASSPMNFEGDLTITSTDYPNSGTQFGALAPYFSAISFNSDNPNWASAGQWSLAAYTASGYWTYLKGYNGILFESGSADTYGKLWQDGGWSLMDNNADPHGGVDPGGPGVLLVNTTTNYNLSYAGNGFASGATGVTKNIAAHTWVNNNMVNGSIWVSAATNLAFFNSAGALVFGPVSVTNAAFPVGPGWTVTNSAATFTFSAF
jgi:hypothetical protein